MYFTVYKGIQMDAEISAVWLGLRPGTVTFAPPNNVVTEREP